MADDNARDEETQAVGGEPTRAVPESPTNPWSTPTSPEPPPPYAQQPPVYGQQPPVYGQQPPVYGQQPAPYGQVGYPQPGYAPAGPPTAGRATAVLITGIASLVLLLSCVGFIPAIVALVLAPGAEREIRESQGRLTGLSQVRAGRICSWITIAITVLFVVIIGVVVAFGLATSGSGSFNGY